MDRFFSPGLTQVSDSEVFQLEGDEAHHLVRVLRAKPGTRIELFDGIGRTALGIVRETTKHSATIEIDKLTLERAESCPLSIAAAFPKGDRLTTMVEKLCELGVSRLIPLSTERSVVDPGNGKLTRLEKLVVSACKQSKRAWMMTIEPTISIERFLPDAQYNCVILAPHANHSLVDVVSKATSQQSPLCCLVGPEGGWSPEEHSLFEKNCIQEARLGRHVLRIETAAIAAASIWAAMNSTGNESALLSST